MPERLIRDVLDEDPSQPEHALPLVLRPDRRGRVVVHLGQHFRSASKEMSVRARDERRRIRGLTLCNSGKMAGRVDAEEEVDGHDCRRLLERLVETLVAERCRAPDLNCVETKSDRKLVSLDPRIESQKKEGD